jgi:hypothetical protein
MDNFEMAEPRCASVKYVVGPGARSLTTDDLPDAEATRWVIRRKAEVVAAVRGGLLSLDEAYAADTCYQSRKFAAGNTPSTSTA